MTRIAIILSFLLLGTLLLTCSEEPTSVSPSPLSVKNRTISGYLKGDGRLVPNRFYGGVEVGLYQQGNVLKTDTTDTTGFFSFTVLDTGTYEIKATADFGFENIAYANEIFVLIDTLLEKDLLLDSLKHDFSPFHFGGSYTYYLEGLLDGALSSEMASTVEITITSVQQTNDTLFYFFEGENRLEYYLYDPIICNSFLEDSISAISGYFKDYNSQVTCVVTEGNGCFFASIFKAVHIYDGSEETNNFLSLISWLSYDPETIEFGVPFVINNEQFETLYLNFNFATMGRSIYQFSDDLGVVTHSDIQGGTNHLSRYKLTLIDYDF